MDLTLKAQRFANDAHHACNQRRKFTGEPYIVHPASRRQKWSPLPGCMIR